MPSDGPPPDGPPRGRADTVRFPCDACGSDMRFDPSGDRLVCDHCGNTEVVTEAGPWGGAIAELDFRAAIEARLPEAETELHRISRCPNCGAEVEFAEALHARDCPFCATPLVAGTGADRRIKPKGVLPFAVAEREAAQAMSDWLGTLWFAPNGLSAYARKGRRLTGIYVPYWTFDARTLSDYDGERGTTYTTGSGKNRTTRVRWRRVRGRVARAFDDVLVLASPSLPASHTDALEPWDLAALEPYRPEFLAGFLAEGYRVSLLDAHDIARRKMDAIIARDVRFDIGGDRQRIHAIRTQVSDVTFKHVLLPVWTAAYRFRGRSFRYVVNGRTGRVQGERPWSPWKIAFAVLLALILGAVLLYLNEGGGGF